MTEGKFLQGGPRAARSVRKARAPREQAVPAMPVAIVGAACRLPGAPDLEAFWSLMARGGDAVGTLPPDRFTQAAFHHPRKGEPGRSYSFAAAHLGDVTGFDAPAFGLSPREASEMDPQQRLLLEVASEALEDAGWPASGLAGRNIGVWVGGSSTDHAELRLSDPAGTDRYFMTGNTLSILSNRLTNVFDLRGPGQTVDTACSSSLVALDAAVAAIRAGQVEAALVGGVQLLLSPFAFAGFSRAGMLSARGRCQAFDAAADGYVRGEGAGLVVLKPLDAALADGDAVRGVILATGTNAAGRTIGLSLPNREAQAALLARVFAQAQADPAELAYFEAHGTGTQVGDPAETWAIGTALAQHRAAPLRVGSVKTNIGHLEPASGMAGLLKAMLVLERGAVPPNLHFNNPNPHIDFDRLNIRVPVALERLEPGGKALAGVNSFGFGGTNASVLLGPAPARPGALRPEEPESGPLPPLVLTARSAAALKSLAAAWQTRPASPSERRGALHHRDLHAHRLVLRGEDTRSLVTAWLAGGRSEGITQGVVRGGAGGPVAFVFSGNGAQFPGMAREAMAHNAAFRHAVEVADGALAPLTGWSGAALLAGGVGAEALSGTDHAQPLLFLVQCGVVAALAEHGLKPAMVLGHSVGEVAAAWAAGILTMDQAARLVVARSRAQHARRGVGRMAAIGAGAKAVQPLLDAADGGRPGWHAEIAARNAPDSVTVAGPEAAIDEVVAAAKARRWPAVKLDLDYAFHSAAMDPVQDALAADLAGLEPAPGQLGFLSSVTGTKQAGTALDAAYWWHNLRDPVRFQDAVQAAVDAGARFFVEIGPHAVLQSYLRDSLRAAGMEAPVMPSLSRRDPEGDPFPALTDRALSQGAFCPAAKGPAEWRSLPHTPYERQRAWFTPSAEAARLTNPAEDHPLLGFRQGSEPWRWSRLLDTALEPWLADHKLGGEPVLPAAAMLDMALAVAALRFPDAAALELREVQILRALPLSVDATREVRTTLESGTNSVTLESRPRLSAEPWTLHMRGDIAAATSAALPDPVPPVLEGGSSLGMEESLAIARRFHLHYGPAFQALREARLSVDRRAAALRLQLPETAPSDAHGWLLHPVRLDGLLQGLVGLLSEGEAADGRAVVPVRFGRLVLRRGAPVPVTGEIRVLHNGERSGLYQLALRDGGGQVVAWLDQGWMQRVRFQPRATLGQSLFRVVAQPGLAARETNGVAPDLATALQAAITADAALDLGETTLLLEGHLVASAQAALRPMAGPDGIIPSRLLTPYASALLHMLAEDGLAAAAPQGWMLPPEADLPAPSEIWQAVQAESPALAHELAWLALAAERMPAVIAGTAGGDAPFLPAEAAGFGRLAAVLAAALESIADAWPKERPLRVLELGAHGGPLTRALLAVLGGSGLTVHYVAAGLPGDSRAAIEPPHAESVAFTHEAWDPLAGPPGCGPVDLVVGLAAAARGQQGAALLPALAAVLAPGGSLLLVEPLPGRAWDFASGQDTGWWRQGASPLPDAQGWLASISGWAEPSVTPLSAAPWPAVLIGARAALADPAEAVPVAPVPALRLVADQGSAALRDTLASALQGAGICVTENEDAHLLVLAAPDTASLPAGLAAIVTLAEAARGRAAGLTLIHGDAATLPEAAALAGLMRVLANEMPGLAPRRIGLDASLSPSEAVRRLLPHLLAPGGEPELHLGSHALLVPRLRPGLAIPATPHGPARLVAAQPGQLSSLEWVAQGEAASPGAGEVSVRIEAAGLNFRDLMWAQGLLPEEALLAGFAGPTLGMEMAGVVERTGPGSRFRPGERVFGFAPSALASRALTREEALVRLPEALDFAAAATVPVAFLTAVYALEHCARLAPGETVLIHGGAGAVGLAALQVAQAAGARIAMTAGSAAKRAYLRAAGAELVLDSRDPGFADRLRAVWPRGVDVVLNSLAGESMEQSLGLVAPFGRFIELGKRDFFENTRVGLRPWRNNLTYHGVDVDQLPKARPELAQRLLQDIADRMAAGQLRPLPLVEHPATEAEAAFRTLQASRHIGKLVMTPPAIPAEASRTGWTPPQGTILVVGGTGGFGLECAKWLAAHGATHLALLSRRGGTAPGAAAAVTTLAALGARATVHAADAADAVALEAALIEIRAEGPPLVGVVHAAAAFDDGAAASLDAARFAAVLEPKLSAARNLDRLTRRDPLSLFLLFSSATTAMGNPGQGNYVAANMALEALARARQAEGLPALAVCWGPIADAGVLAADAATAETLARRLGTEAMTAAEALSALPVMLKSGEPVVGLARIGWREVGRALPILAEPLFDAVRGRAEAAPEGGMLRDHLLSLPPEEARALLRQTVQEEVGRILRLPAEAVPPDAPVAGLGLDSLGGMELRGALEQRLGMAVPLTSVTEDLTIDLLSRKLADALSGNRATEEMVAGLVEQFEPSAAGLADTEPPRAEAAE
ncbi:SDR family NAD(P)-dependent oxidoreductase [Pseudoroseomonas globiformis]|uniref:SDR family NAD(P)-dependent oxidoreductase n=1 Tax=Teichococcus globiformis TaxID=2307229 RepID=A0ABV7FXL8_9PROT